MTTVNFSSSNCTTFLITPLHDDGSNFVDSQFLGQNQWKTNSWPDFTQSWQSGHNSIIEQQQISCTHETHWCLIPYEALENKLLEIKYVPTDENIVDIFTKPLSRPLFEKFRGMLGLCYAWGGVLRLWQAHIYSMNFFPITFFYFLLYPTIDSALTSHYLDYSFIVVSSSYSKLRCTLIIYPLFWIQN